MMTSQIKDFTKDDDAEMYINILIDLIKNSSEILNQIYLSGIVKFHIKSCAKPTS